MVFEETIFSENINYDNFNVFIRDLSSSITTNLKYMIEDIGKEDTDIEESKGKKSKKKHIKKADLIIQQQNLKRKKILIDKDNKCIEFFLDNLNLKNPYTDFNKLQTEEGKLNFKLKLFEKYYKKPKYLHHTLNLYFHLKDTDKNKLSEKQLNTFSKFNKKLLKYDYKYFMFVYRYHIFK